MKFKYNDEEYELIVLTLAGSKLYGNSRPESDTDYRGIFIAPNKTKLGLLGKVEQIDGKNVLESLKNEGLELEDTEDIILYEINRFINLAINNNPNIMDILFHDYTKSANIYLSEKGKELLENKELFISKKLKYTFSGYAISQLKRIKSHNKWIKEFPRTEEVLNKLKEHYENNLISFNWCSDNFGSSVASKVENDVYQNKLNKLLKYKEEKEDVTNIEKVLHLLKNNKINPPKIMVNEKKEIFLLWEFKNSNIKIFFNHLDNSYNVLHFYKEKKIFSENNILINKDIPMNIQKLLNKELNNNYISWEEFIKDNEFINKYRIPRLLDFCNIKNLKSKKLELTEENRNFLMKEASFRTINKNTLIIYSKGKGIFSNEGNLKRNEPEVIGEFKFILSIDELNYKSKKDHVNKMWHWKINRNKKRGKLEENYGFDTKHASHLVRLMEGAKEILEKGTYIPELYGERLKLVNDVRDGKYSYEWVLEYSKKLDKELEEKYKKSNLKRSPDIKKINELLLKLLNAKPIINYPTPRCGASFT